MKLVDANVLLYAVNSSEPRHDDAREWLDGALGGRETVAFTWVVLLAFLRLSTRAGLFPSPLPIADALAQVRDWTAQPPSVLLEPTGRHLDVLAGLLTDVGAGGNLVTDAHLATLAVEHHATVITYDADFARFRGVAWARPGDGSAAANP